MAEKDDFEDEMMQSKMMDLLAHEIMNGLQKKDVMQFRMALTSLIANVLNELEKDEPEHEE